MLGEMKQMNINNEQNVVLMSLLTFYVSRWTHHKNYTWLLYYILYISLDN